MKKRILPALCALLLSTAAWAQTLPEAPAPADAAPEQIVIVGKKPGPGLWKVSKGDHVLWIFGTHSPLPAKMEWRSQEVETIIAQSQAFLLSPSMSASVGFFTQLTLLPFAIGVKNNPDGATLRDLVPADVYARWSLLKKKYIGENDDIERERPIFAAAELHRKGLAHAGLASDRDVRNAIEKLVKQYKLKWVSSNVQVPLESPHKLLRQFKRSSFDDVACFTHTMDRLEVDIADLRARAQAWAVGDLAVLRKRHVADSDDACLDAVLNSSVVKNQPAFQDVPQRMRESWLASAEKALAGNTSTFAVLSLQNLLGNKSFADALAARGYTVQSPE